ncbi:collagen alpha-1(I) chain-like [Heliangelus exortis]|uniref:collagen alpha-1(I) chain-like n=1 Tax=Heliangelus exortis TaxID=472823 RepID=UPI003A93289D
MLISRRTPARAARKRAGRRGQAESRPCASPPDSRPRQAQAGKPQGPAAQARTGGAASATSALPAPGAGRRGGAAPLKGPAGPRCHPRPPCRAERAGSGGEGLPRTNVASVRERGRRHGGGGRGSGSPNPSSARPSRGGRGAGRARPAPSPASAPPRCLAAPAGGLGSGVGALAPVSHDESGTARIPRPGGGPPAAAAPRADPTAGRTPTKGCFGSYQAQALRPPGSTWSRPDPRRSPSPSGEEGQCRAPARAAPSPHTGGAQRPHQPRPCTAPHAGATRQLPPAGTAGHRWRPSRRGRTPSFPPPVAPSVPFSEQPPTDFARPAGTWPGVSRRRRHVGAQEERSETEPDRAAPSPRPHHLPPPPPSLHVGVAAEEPPPAPVTHSGRCPLARPAGEPERSWESGAAPAPPPI